MPSTPLRQRWSRHDRSPWTTWGGLGAHHKTPGPGARLGPQRENSQWLLPSLGEVRKRFFVKYSRHHVFSSFPTSTKPLKFRNPLSTSQLFFAYQFENATSFVQQSWTDPRGQGPRTSRGSQGRPATVAPPGMGHHSAPKNNRWPQHYFWETLIPSITRSVDWKCKLWTQSSSVRRAVRRDSMVEHLRLWRLKNCNTKRAYFPSQTLLLNELSCLTFCRVVFCCVIAKNRTSASTENKRTPSSVYCLKGSVNWCTRANGRLSGLPSAKSDTWQSRVKQKIKSLPEGNHTHRSLVQWFSILFRHRLSQ